MWPKIKIKNPVDVGMEEADREHSDRARMVQKTLPQTSRPLDTFSEESGGQGRRARQWAKAANPA